MTNDNLDQFEPILLEFEEAWQAYDSVVVTEPLSASMPSIETFIQRSGRFHQELWAELAKINIEHRLRRQLEPLSVDYLAGLKKLDDENRLDVVEYEFSMRKRFNQPVSKDEVNERFEAESDRFAALINNTTDTVVSNLDSSVASQPKDISLHLTPGANVKQYVVKNQIGIGSFSFVYRAKDTKLGRDVALKFLRPHISRNNNMRDRMFREAQAVATLDHNNIVPVIETGSFKNHDFIVYRFIDGMDLGQLIEKRDFTIREAADLVGQIAAALEHSHRHGVVHRDIKPANIIVDQDNKPMLLDFGLAYLGEDSIKLTNTGDVVGTPAFMPPEQADGRAWQADPRSDIYSLGVVLFNLVCSRLPFEGNTVEVIKQVIEQPAPAPKKINPSIDRDLQTIILKCLEKEPSDRFQTAALMRQDLENYLVGKPILARPVGAVQRTVKWAKRRPVLASLFVMLLLATAFAVGGWSQLQYVKKERDRAITAENQVSNLFAEQSADAGRLATQRGQLKDALKYFDESISRGSPDAIDLRLDKLSVLLATRQIEAAKAELDKIIESTEPNSEFAGQVSLWKAELALEGYSDFGAPISLINDARKKGLDRVSEIYADGMMADTSLDAIRHFEKALQIDPFHHRARRMLITMNLSLGRIDDAENECRIALELFPNDVDFHLFQGIVESYHGNDEAVTEILNSIEMDEPTKTKWKSFFRYVDRVCNELILYPGSFGYSNLRIHRTIDKFKEDHLPLLKTRGIHFPPKISRALVGLPEILTDVSTSPTLIKANVIALDEISKVHPEGSIYSVKGNLLAQLQNIKMETETADEKFQDPELLQQGLEAFENSSKGSGLIKSVRETNWLGIYANAVSLAVVSKIDVEQNKKQMISAAKNLNPARLYSNSHLRAVVVGLMRIGEYELAKPYAQRWSDFNGGKKLDAVWHLILCDRWQNRWYDVLRQCNAAIEEFPEHQPLVALRDAAIKNLKDALPESRQDD